MVPTSAGHFNQNDPCPTNGSAGMESGVYCEGMWDGLSCFPATRAGEMAVQPCPSLGPYTTNNATRHCLDNGIWQNKTDYSHCMLEEYNHIHDDIINVIYYVGFSISTVTLTFALFVFMRFRVLRCLRNNIHCHLIISFLFRNIFWYCTQVLAVRMRYKQLHMDMLCKALVVLLHYFHVSTFFWMFIEGLYLHTICVWAFSADRIQLAYFVIIAWGTPMLVIIVWAVVKWKYENTQCWLEDRTQGQSSYDLIYILPSLFVLLLNVIFLLTIIWILVTKLRASTTIQTKHFRKTLKALLVLVPLFGITWLLFLVPLGNNQTSQLLFLYCNAILESLQGFAVAVFFCFLNCEVQYILKMKFKKWKESRRLRSMRCSRDSYHFFHDHATPERDTCIRPHLKMNANQNYRNNSKDSGRGSDKCESADAILIAKHGTV